MIMFSFNPLPDCPILGPSNQVENKDIMAKMWINGNTIIGISRKHCGKRRNCLSQAISPFPTMFSKAVCLLMCSNKYLWSKGLKSKKH